MKAEIYLILSLVYATFIGVALNRRLRKIEKRDQSSIRMRK